MVRAYYAARGWDADGRVPGGLVERLGLAEVLGEEETGPTARPRPRFGS
jgi:hypothetical protein